MADRLERNEDDLIDLVVAEVGKPLMEASEEVRRAVSIVRYHAAAALDPTGHVIPDPDGGSLLYTNRRPLGVVGLITPWNFPIAIPLWKLAPALSYGNAVVWKPAPHSTAVAFRLAEFFEDLPAGALEVVPGGSDTGHALSRAKLDGLSFTGSTVTGRAVAREVVGSSARFQAELGGKNASVVLKSADLERAARIIAAASMGFAGQKCTATSRVIVERPVAQRFHQLLDANLQGLKVGNPADPSTNVGPMIEPEAVERTVGFVERCKQESGKVTLGGAPLPDLGPGFMAPTLITEIDAESELAQTEVFGPVLALFVVEGSDDALTLANSSEYGLAAAVFTNDLSQALAFADSLEAGVVRVNAPTPGVVFNAPFGPVKASGIGLPEQGKAAQQFFTTERTVSVVRNG